MRINIDRLNGASTFMGNLTTDGQFWTMNKPGIMGRIVRSGRGSLQGISLLIPLTWKFPVLYWHTLKKKLGWYLWICLELVGELRWAQNQLALEMGFPWVILISNSWIFFFLQEKAKVAAAVIFGWIIFGLDLSSVSHSQPDSLLHEVLLQCCWRPLEGMNVAFHAVF